MARCAVLICAILLMLGIVSSVHAERRMLGYYRGGSSGSSPSSGGGYGGSGGSGYGSGSSPSSGSSGYGSGSSPSSGSGGYGSSSPSSGGSGYGSSPSSGSSGYGGSSPSSGSSSPSSGAGNGTPKYWCGHPEKVPKILSLLSSIAKIFGPRILSHFHKPSGAPSLFGALKDESNDDMTSLAREGSAALINSYAYSAQYPLSSVEVISRFNNALESPDLVAQQAVEFQRFNEAL